MKPSERNEKRDRTTALVVTILVHAIILAALFFVGMPDKKAKPATEKIENQSLADKLKPKA